MSTDVWFICHRTISLRTTETAYGEETELNYSEVVLSSAIPIGDGPSPSSYPFSIPLPSDTPQCIHTPRSSLIHTLSATLYSVDESETPLSKSILVHTRRYTSHSNVLGIAPETKAVDSPTRIEVQVPRTSYKAGEPIPLYLTVPSPRRELILDEGLRLRNIRAELVRIVKAKRTERRNGTAHGGHDASEDEESTEDEEEAPSNLVRKQLNWPSSHPLDLRSFLGVPGGGDVVALSGASCRLHPSRPLRLRLILHQPHDQDPLITPTRDFFGAPDDERQESITECASISQNTVSHSVSFTICVHITFIHMSSHTERVSTISIPIAIVPPSAPLPEVEESIDNAYRKKHDRPPVKTVRREDADTAHALHEGQAGPSYQPNGAPPPFEEREAPPPFFPSAPEPSTSRPPTFLESETEIYVPPEEDPSIAPLDIPRFEYRFEGEGSLFGFAVEDQFDGYVSEQQIRPDTPPPTLEMATMDTDVTSLATLSEGDAINALELAFEQRQGQETTDTLPPPPPPPPMDDPSDPPPSIDSEFRTPSGIATGSPPHPHVPPPAFTEPMGPEGLPPPLTPLEPPPPAHGHAPPPYAIPGNDPHPHGDHEHVARPPPYVG